MEKLHVDKDRCIGCGLCVSMNEEHFEFNDEGVSYAKNPEVKPEEKNDLLSIVDSCPVEAITIEEEIEEDA